MATWLEELENSDSDWSDATNEASGIEPGSISDSPAMETDPLDFLGDLQESVGLTEDWTPSSSGNYSSGADFSFNTQDTASGAGLSTTSSVVKSVFADGLKDKTWTDGFRDFIKTNQADLLKLGFGLVQGMATESSKQKTAAAAAQSQIDQITLKDKLEQDKSKRIGDSIKGLAPVKKWGGNLKRTDGSSVFQPTGLINMGAKA